MSKWSQFNNGDTLGHRGSEGGTIIRDEEYSGGARITLEKATTTAAYVITCGIFNWLAHTVFLNTNNERSAQNTFESIKRELERVAEYANREPFTSEDQDLLIEQIEDFVHRY